MQYWGSQPWKMIFCLGPHHTSMPGEYSLIRLKRTRGSCYLLTLGDTCQSLGLGKVYKAGRTWVITQRRAHCRTPICGMWALRPPSSWPRGEPGGTSRPTCCPRASRWCSLTSSPLKRWHATVLSGASFSACGSAGAPWLLRPLQGGPSTSAWPLWHPSWYAVWSWPLADADLQDPGMTCSLSCRSGPGCEMRSSAALTNIMCIVSRPHSPETPLVSLSSGCQGAHLVSFTSNMFDVTECCIQIGGVRAPSPVGELGNVEMTQATELSETRWECIGRDMLLTGESAAWLSLPCTCATPEACRHRLSSYAHWAGEQLIFFNPCQAVYLGRGRKMGIFVWLCRAEALAVSAGYLPSSYGPASLNALLDQPPPPKREDLPSSGIPQGPHMPTINPKADKEVRKPATVLFCPLLECEAQTLIPLILL